MILRRANAGRAMSFDVYNTLTRKKEPFRALEPGLVRMYNCGPTVYGRAHIGNFRAYLFADTLRRWLEVSGYRVRQVMNITDVGHLLDDADEGEDKIEAQARREKLDPWAISRRHTEQFFQDLEDLGCLPAAVYPKASEHIPEMLDMIAGLVEKGYAYQVGGDVYYEVSKFPRYGRLSGNTVAELEAGARIDVREEKRHPADFALWKSDPQHLMKWPSRYGEHGFPGWHIECSAMARKHLGDRIDIHTGGEDNVFPHHECEIAQTEAFTGEPFATTWMHTKFLQVDGGKMSKRLGNCWSLDDVRARGHSIRALRFCLLRGHYRTPLNFTWDILREAASVLENLDDLVVRLRRAQSGAAGAASADAGIDEVGEALAEFKAAMDDDLNVPRAVASLMELRALALEDRLGASAAAQALQFVVHTANRALGCIAVEESSLATDVEARIRARLAARRAKDFARADALRDELAALGITLEDSQAGVLWKHKASGAGGGPIT
jgi:cysteinyl-tRNA synthetase